MPCSPSLLFVRILETLTLCLHRNEIERKEKESIEIERDFKWQMCCGLDLRKE